MALFLKNDFTEDYSKLLEEEIEGDPIESTSDEGETEQGGLSGLPEVKDAADEAFVQESLSDMWLNLQEAAMRAEHKAILESDTTLLENVIVDYWDKVIEWFKRLWNAVKQFFKNIWMKIEALWMNKLKWVQKYEKQIAAGALIMEKRKTPIFSVDANTAKNSLNYLTEYRKFINSFKSIDSLEAATKINEQFTNKVGQFNSIQTKSTPATAALVKTALATVSKLVNDKSTISDSIGEEIAEIKRAIKIAEDGKKSTTNESKIKALKGSIAVAKYKIKALKHFRSKVIAASNKTLSIAFKICKQAASAGARGVKAAFKAGAKPNGVAKFNDSGILSQFGLND